MHNTFNGPALHPSSRDKRTYTTKAHDQNTESPRCRGVVNAGSPPG